MTLINPKKYFAIKWGWFKIEAYEKWREFRESPLWIQYVCWIVLGVALGAIEWLVSGTFM